MKLTLSQLADDIEIGVEGSHLTYTAGEVKEEILKFGESHHETPNWYTIKRNKWTPDASSMIESYIENESHDMYEDWYDVAMERIDDQLTHQIQALLEQAFKGKDVTTFWTYDKPVEIDILPNSCIRLFFQPKKDIYWIHWGRMVKAFEKGNTYAAMKHTDGTITARSPYHQGLADDIELDAITLL